MPKKRKQIEKIKYDLISPFGPKIMIGKMPDVILDDFEKIIEQVLNEKQKNHGPGLAGRIDDEYEIIEDLFMYNNVGKFLDAIVEQYVIKVVEETLSNNLKGFGKTKDNRHLNDVKITTDRIGAWVNSMKSGEYNPAHYHPNCNITTVFFFDDVNSEFIDEIIAPTQTDSFDFGEGIYKKGTTEDGILRLFYNSNNYFDSGQWGYRPKRGRFLIFPAWLIHGVYPFISSNRRRSASVNYMVQTNDYNTSFGVR